MTFRPISISLSPNIERDDIYLALKLILQPWRWKKGDKISKLEENFKKYFKVKHTISFNSGRSALLAILESLQLKGGEEVLLQAFTCNAAANPILWSRLHPVRENFSGQTLLRRSVAKAMERRASQSLVRRAGRRQDYGGQTGLKPVYVDCDEETFNIDTKDLKKKITSRSRVVIVQHTFGLPADIKKILEICKKNNLILIEDCAHSLGATYKNKKVGTFGKAAFFSFSRDKVISSVYGGMAITNDNNLAEKIKDFQKKAGFPSNPWIFQQLLHPILMNYLILPTYQFLGKYLLILLQRLYILSKAVHWKEKKGEKPDYFPKALPHALATLAYLQFKKLRKPSTKANLGAGFNHHRKEIAKFYYKNLRDTSFQLPKLYTDREHIFLRFPVKHPKAHQIIKKAWRENILIGDWYDKVIAPHGTKLDKMKYKKGSCKKAEKLAKETLNLPTHINISKKEAKRIIDFLILKNF